MRTDSHGCQARPLETEPWYPNILEMAKAAGVAVSLFHNWAPLGRIFSSGFLASGDVRTTFCSDGAVRDQYDSSLVRLTGAFSLATHFLIQI
eukprot:COSAG03_NODE_4748_length_1445_cov_2.664190_1_plen_92_part_00